MKKGTITLLLGLMAIGLMAIYGELGCSGQSTTDSILTPKFPESETGIPAAEVKIETNFAPACPAGTTELGKETLKFLPAKCDLIASINPDDILKDPIITKIRALMASDENEQIKKFGKELETNIMGMAATASDASICLNFDLFSKDQFIKSFIVIATAKENASFRNAFQLIVDDMNEEDKEEYKRMLSEEFYTYDGNDNMSIFVEDKRFAFGTTEFVRQAKDNKSTGPTDADLIKTWGLSRAGTLKVASLIDYKTFLKKLDNGPEIEAIVKEIGLNIINGSGTIGLDWKSLCLEFVLAKNATEIMRNITKVSRDFINEFDIDKTYEFSKIVLPAWLVGFFGE